MRWLTQNTEFFDFNGDVFQLQDGVLVPYEPPPVADDFWGQTIDYSWRVPDFNNVYYNTEVTIGPGVEISGIFGQAGWIPLDFTEDQIIADFPGFAGFPSHSFIGFSVFDEYNVLPEIFDVNITLAPTYLDLMKAESHSMQIISMLTLAAFPTVRVIFLRLM